MPLLLRTTLRPPPPEFPHLVERESQRPRKLGNGVPASFPRPAFHIPYGGRGYPTLLGEFLYGKPPLLPYPSQLKAQTFFAHAACLFSAASTSSPCATSITLLSSLSYVCSWHPPLVHKTGHAAALCSLPRMCPAWR